ncbi:MAG: TIGR02679 family protein [Pseudonocardiales bacterium]|nr:TIGR02679 family protein [Pseudonocardiales bacterium]
MSPDPRLARLLGGDELDWLVQRARHRLERGKPLTGLVTLAQASPQQRDALARLLGRRPRPGAGLTVRWDAVDDVLRRSGMHPDGLASAIVALTGPIRDRAAEARAAERAWSAAFTALDAVIAGRPVLAEWATNLRTGGLIRRLAGTPETTAPLLAELSSVLAALPAEAEPIGRFAERVLGSAHALDQDRPLATLVFGAAKVLGATPEGSGAAWRREVWAGVRLLRDDLSNTVLVLGLPGDSASATGRVLATMGAAGQPTILTLRQIVADPPRLDLTGRTVSICENPVVVGLAADRLASRCPPLVCVGGQPGAAVMHLLRLLGSSGGQLRYHGDFDWGGVRIGNVLFGRLPMQPWRFDAASYQAAVADGGGLSGPPAEPLWDPDLGAAMRTAGRVVEEERVADVLLADLADLSA